MTRSILILDADQSAAKLVSNLLNQQGYRLTTCTSGKKALGLILELGAAKRAGNGGQTGTGATKPKNETEVSGFDLVVVGEQLDDIDGIGWIDKLRRENTRLHVVLISSVWRDAGIYQKLRQDLSVSLVIHRPVNKLLFAGQIEAVLEQHQLKDNKALMEEQGAVALRIKFNKILPARLDTLKKALDAVRSAPHDIALIKEANRLAHNLKGTSRSSGFELVGDAAEQLENAIARLRACELEQRQEMLIAVESTWNELTQSADREIKDSNALAKLADPQVLNADHDPAALRVLVVSPEDIIESTKNATIPLVILKARCESEAKELAAKTTLDAAVIDVGHDQAEQFIKLCRDLRHLPGNETLPIAFVSNDHSDPAETTHAGAAIHLNKPLNVLSLNDAVEFLTSVREGGRARIMIVDDDEDFCELVAAALGREGMMVRSLHQPSNILAVLNQYCPDLLLLDVNMPLVSGFEVCRMLRASGRWQNLPVLFLTAETGLDARLAAFEAGADDYLPKPVAMAELLTRVRIRLERARFLKERADKDVLTGLLIRRASVEVLKSIQEDSCRHNFPFSVALIDIDLFKSVNDTYGHLAGDRVLASFGQLLRRRFRAQDSRGRWGGEEFLVTFRHESSQTVKGALERVLAEFRSEVFSGDHGESFNVSFSCGLASYPEDGSDYQRLLLVADYRLYAAKSAGRNCVICTNPVESKHA